jgi:hypothetical protein
MFLLVPIVLMFAATLALLILRVMRPQFRFAWLIGVGAAFFSWISVLLWRMVLPLSISFGAWGPPDLLPSSPALAADPYAWLYALSLAALALATLLTETVREGFPDVGTLAANIGACGLGLAAVVAANPLTLALLWAALDLVELVVMLNSQSGRPSTERVVTAFAVHAAAIVVLMLAQVTGGSVAKPATFASINPQADLLLLIAAGLRLIVLPLQLPYVPGHTGRRSVGTTIRLSSAAASLVLLSRVPAANVSGLGALLLLVIAAAASLYAGWMWLRAPDELAGRPFWILGLAGLALFAGLRGNPAGAAGWGVALILAGGALFLSSAQQIWLRRLLFLGAWEISALPFSITASGWGGGGGLLAWGQPLFVVVQALLVAGFIRHVLRPSPRASLQTQPNWTRSVYPAGIGLLLLLPFGLAFWGWEGALQIGSPINSVIAALIAAALVWAVPRLRVLNPVPAHWLRPMSGSRLDAMERTAMSLYRALGGLTQTITDVLEGEAGLMWTLLFLVLFILLIVQRTP